MNIHEEIKIAYCIPTHHKGSEYIKQVFDKSLSMLNEYGVDVYVYDSSSDDETKKVVEEYKNINNNIYYRRFSHSARFIEKAVKIFDINEFEKEYDYVWLVKDRVFVSEEIVERITKVAVDEPDAIFLRAIEAQHTVNLKTKDYSNPVEFYHDWAWLVTSFDCTILRTKTVLENIEWNEIIKKYAVNNDISYILVALLFNEIIKYEKCKISVLDAEVGKHIFNLPKREDILKKSESLLFEIWGKQWYHINMNLPDIYNAEKEFVIKSASTHQWMIGNHIRLMSIWQSGNLTDDKLECVKDIWNGISDVPWEDVCRIKNGDIDFMRCCFVDLVWENVAVGNMNQVINYYSECQWLFDQIDNNEDLRYTIYMIEVFLYERQCNNIHIFDGGRNKEYIIAKIQLAIKLVKVLEENDNVQSKELKAVINNKLISISMIEYFIVKLCSNPELVAERFNVFIKENNMENEYKNETDDINSKYDVYYNRKQVLYKLNDSVDVTIGIVAYNRLDITKLCIQSVLDNTKDIKYKLVLVYNENEQGEGILEFFNAIDYKDKVVIHIKENIGAPFAYQYINKHIDGKYFVHLPNDVIVTPNWLSNLIKCAESDHRIGMVNPVSSNVSNLQCVDLSFDSYDEMQKNAADYNISNPLKWQERIRLITLGTLFTRECLSAIGPVFDIGFMHDFGDDDVSFRVRRAGYKAVLACDTWVHHAHDVFHMENKNPEEYQKSLKEGRENFNQKYYGIDPWDDVNNFVFPYIEKKITPPADKNNVKVLGIDVKCGTPILDIKNCLRTFNVIDLQLHAFTSDAKYYIDLKTICDDVVCDRHEYLINSFKKTKFDYIIIGDSINSYNEPEQTIEYAYSLLNNGGQLFISLKNTYNAITMLKMLGHSVGSEENILQIEFNSFYNSLKKRNMKIELINCQLYDLSDAIIDYCSNLIRHAKSNDCKEEDLLNQLRVDSYWFKITK